MIGKWDTGGALAERIMAEAEADPGMPVRYGDHAVWGFWVSVLRTRGNADVWDIDVLPLDG